MTESSSPYLHGFSPVEQARLIGLLDSLAAYLGAPGDWGYGTTLGNLTISVLNARQAVRTAPVESRS